MIIPLALVVYEMIIANSYPTHAHGIIVKYIPTGLCSSASLCYPEEGSCARLISLSFLSLACIILTFYQGDILIPCRPRDKQGSD